MKNKNKQTKTMKKQTENSKCWHRCRETTLELLINIGTVNTLLMGMWNGAAVVETSLMVAQNDKHSITCIQQFHSLVYTQNNWEQTRNRNSYTNVCSIIIHNSWKVETTQLFTMRRMVKGNAPYTYNAYLAIKRNEIWVHVIINETWKHYAK